MLNCSISQQMSIAANAPRSGLCKPCWVKNLRGEMMNRVHTIAFRLLVVSLFLCSCFASLTLAQTASPSPKPEAKPANQGDGNPFAPQPAPPLPPGMTGSDASDPRASLTPGMYDAG